MRLKYLYIKKYCNLNEFEWDFNGKEQSPLTVLLGKNSAGKSNLLEALLLIFRNLRYYDKLPIPFEYKIDYSIYNHNITISTSRNDKIPYSFQIDNDTLTISEIQQRTSSWRSSRIPKGIENILPENVIVYYSGYSKRMEEHFEKSDAEFISALIENNIFNIRPFFYFKPIHYRFIMLGLFASQLSSIKDFLNKRLLLKSLDEIEIIIQKPSWAKLKTDNKDNFWRAAGNVKSFFDYLELISQTNKLKEVNEIVFTLDKNSFSKLTQSDIIFNETELVKYLDAANLSDYIKEVKIFFYKSPIVDRLEFAQLSEGEQQLITIQGIIELLREKESLFLLDEPDTYLHPDWQRDFMQILQSENSKDHYIIATHSPQSLSMVHNDSVMLMQNGKGYSINAQTFGQESSVLLEDILEVSRRPIGIQDLSDEYFKLLSENKLEDAKEIRSKLEELLGPNDLIFIKADAILKRKAIIGK